MFLNLHGLALLLLCCAVSSLATGNWNSSSSAVCCASHGPLQLEYGTSTSATYSTTTVIVTIQDRLPNTSLPPVVSVPQTSVGNGKPSDGFTTLQSQSSARSSDTVDTTNGSSHTSIGSESSDSSVSMASPTNAYMVLSEALETESLELGTATATTVSHAAVSSVTRNSYLSSASSPTTLPQIPSSMATTPLPATAGASFTLDGVSYTAFRPAGISSPNLVIQGGQMTTTINPAQPATLPVNYVVSLDQNGNPVAAGSTAYLTTLSASLATVLQSSGNRSTPVATGYPTPSYGVWGNGIPSASSTSAGTRSMRCGTGLQIALVGSALLALALRR